MRFLVLSLLGGCLILQPPPPNLQCEIDGAENTCARGMACDQDFGGCVDYCYEEADCQPGYHCCDRSDEDCDNGDCILD